MFNLSSLLARRPGAAALTLRTGGLAYFDTIFNGLVPVKVLAIAPASVFPLGESGVRVTFRVTAARGGWVRGQVDTFGTHDVIPRAAVYRRRGGCGHLWIKPYSVVVDGAAPAVRNVGDPLAARWGISA